MRALLALVAMAAPAFADEPAPVVLPAPSPAPRPAPAPGPQDAPAPAPAPPVDPAYGERQETGTHAADPEARRQRDIVVGFHPDRSRNNITMLAVTGGAGVLLGVLGLYFHFDTRSATDRVASDRFTGETWSPAHQDLVDQAERSSTIAAVSYGVGGALLIATAVAYIVTEPKFETRVIRPHTNPAPVAIVPVRGGAVVGSGWSF